MPDDDALLARISARLLPTPQTRAADDPLEPDWMPDDPFDRPAVPAAVLIGLIRRPEGLSVLYTERSPELRSHSGQVSFPGGRIEPGEGPGDAALREANEEVALDPSEATILGYMPYYFTGTNYLITPVVAAIEPALPFVANPREVRTVFEVPLDWLADEDSYGTHMIKRGDVVHSTWEIHHGGIRIWGITANLTRRFRDLALLGDEAW